MKKKNISFEVDDNLGKYFKEIKKSKILSQKEEIELAKKIKAGDNSALDKLVSSNLKFVISIAREYQGQGLSLCDLINEGNYGLIKAATRFDHTKGFRFISYAVWWVKQSIIQSLNDNSRTVRLPSNVINRVASLKKEIIKFEIENERLPFSGEILNKDCDAICLETFPKPISLNEVINEDGDELSELIEDVDNDIYYEVTNNLTDEINDVLSVLDDREKKIIELYFGINSEYESMTLEAIGEKFGLTKERIRQIKEKAIRKLRHNSEKLYLYMNQ